jgi:hypothetical protein
LNLQAAGRFSHIETAAVVADDLVVVPRAGHAQRGGQAKAGRVDHHSGISAVEIVLSLTPEERAAFVEKEVAYTERGVPHSIRAATARPAPALSELAAKLDELYAAIEHLPFSDRMEILRGLGDAIGDGTGIESASWQS